MRGCKKACIPVFIKGMTLPNEFCARMRALLGEEYEAFLRSYEGEIYSGIRINTLKCGNDIAEELGAAEKVDWCPDGYYINKKALSGAHPYHAAGMFYFQEPSAMCAAQAVPVAENPKILDLCAAPGGKTTQLAARMKNRGLLISNEIVPRRAAILAENVERMGITNTIVTNESPSRLSARFPAFFDAVMVDAPCSGEGMFRKEPQAVQEWSVAHTVSCAARQKNILDEAYKMVKPGGYIVYSTCTFSYDENEAVVKYMADTYGMDICSVPSLSMLAAGLGGFERCRRVFPHRHKGEGHFAALLRKTDDDTEQKTTKTAGYGKAVSDAVERWREFEGSALNIKCEGSFVMFGENLYLMPAQIDINKLKIMRCGLQLGALRNNRFIPAHALSHAFAASAYKNIVELDVNSAELDRYMRGDVIPGGISGWCVVSVRGCGIGWGKASGGMIKNHYPKGLRKR